MKEIRHERARSAQGTRAGFVSQALATALDFGTVVVLEFLALMAFGFLRFLVTDKDYAMPQAGPGGNTALFFVIGVLLLWTAWSGSGRAPGMSVLGLKVVGRDGRRPLSSGRAFWRAVLAVPTLGLGVVWVLVSRKNKSLYDLICGSAVIYDWRASLPESRQNR
jgi:uncharacterized RDD family membrane protein YckC